ncbi:MAG: AtpZ/AtpI family protein [Oscillospiraceae bacterium]|nr:AtpZ/AtpI family protein [Oscillospiraceae bacterium]
MKSGYSALKLLTYLTQLGISVAAPLVIFIVGALWLREKFSLGSWIVLLGVVLGLMGAAGGFVTNLRTMKRLADRQEKQESKISYNDHR